MWWTVAKEAVANWSGHKDARQGAALAYYSVFSLGPIILIATAVAGLLFGPEAVTGQVMSSLKEMLGENGAKRSRPLRLEPISKVVTNCRCIANLRGREPHCIRNNG